MARATRVIGRCPASTRRPLPTRGGCGHAGPAERRVDIEGVGGDAVADPARIAVEQVRRDDLVIIVGGVGKAAFAVAIAERPDARDIGAQLVVDGDVAALVAADPGPVEAEILAIGAAPDRQQQVRAHDFGRALGAVDGRGDAVAVFGEADAFGVQPDIDAVALDYLPDRRRNVLVFARNQPRRHFDDGDRAAEAPVHLGKFEADIAAADDHQMPRQKIDRHHRGVGQIGNLVETGHRRHRRAAADIDEDPLGPQPLAADFDLARRQEPRMAAMQFAVRVCFERGGQTISELRHHRVLARLDPFHIDRDPAGDRDPVFGGMAREVGGIGARHQGLGRGAAGIDAGAADQVAFDDRHLHAGAGETERQRRPGLAGADDDRVVVGHRCSRPAQPSGRPRRAMNSGKASSARAPLTTVVV